MEGFLNINKSKGITSYDVIRKVKSIFKESKKELPKIGHTGTLDPFATGVLVLCLGRKYTKQAEKIQNLKKKYVVKIKLGFVSDTYDSTGIIKRKSFKKERITLKIIKIALNKFQGNIEQIPPIFSAKKINGKRAYQLARKGKTFKMRKNKVTIYNIKILEYKVPYIILSIECSKGTYIRSIAHDLGEILKVGGYAEELKRTAIGNFKIENTLAIEDLNIEKIKSHLIKII